MLKPNFTLTKKGRRVTDRGLNIFVFLSLTIFVWCVGFTPTANAQAVAASPRLFRIGEKLTYNLSFGKINDGGYAEMYVVSSGRLSGKDVVEIRSRSKTQGIINAAFFTLDESRTVFAAPDTGLPLYVRRVTHEGPEPTEVVNNYLKDPTSNFDLLTVMYKAREAGGIGTYPFLEGGQTYTATFQTKNNEKVKVDAGEFDTLVSIVQSDLLTANGIKELKINFTNDEDRVPVLIRGKTTKGEFRASLVSVHVDAPVAAPTQVVSPTPKPISTPRPVSTPRPTPSPTPYIENQPLSSELGFQLGETLNYNITTGGKPVAAITLSAAERKLYLKQDSLLLTATIMGTEPGNTAFRLGDSVNVQVDPDTLAPKWYESKFVTPIVGLNQTVTFDQRTGNVSFGGAAPYDGPVGTHSLLSLVYAMRSFNLKTSKDPNNPVNDTRVAVFWESTSYIFVLRPSDPADININGEKVSAQQITVLTGNSQLDSLKIKVWLRMADRVPVRFTFGAYQADLTSQSNSIK